MVHIKNISIYYTIDDLLGWMVIAIVGVDGQNPTSILF